MPTSAAAAAAPSSSSLPPAVTGVPTPDTSAAPIPAAGGPGVAPLFTDSVFPLPSVVVEGLSAAAFSAEYESCVASGRCVPRGPALPHSPLCLLSALHSGVFDAALYLEWHCRRMSSPCSFSAVVRTIGTYMRSVDFLSFSFLKVQPSPLPGSACFGSLTIIPNRSFGTTHVRFAARAESWRTSNH